MADPALSHIEGLQAFGMALAALEWRSVGGGHVSNQVEAELGVRVKLGIVKGQLPLRSVMFGMAGSAVRSLCQRAVKRSRVFELLLDIEMAIHAAIAHVFGPPEGDMAVAAG